MRPPRADRTHWFAAFALVPMLVWWLGWYPGFASSDSIDQWTQGKTGDYLNNHPPIHTWYLEVMSLGNTRPGLVTLFQILVLTGLLILAARWLIELGVPRWLALGAAIAVGAAPAVSTTTLALWKDVVFGLCLLWAWIELIGLARDQWRWDRTGPLVRLGLALGGVWVFRGNGPLTVALFAAGLAWIHRRRLRRAALPLAIALVTALLLTFPVAWLLDVTGAGIDPSQVFLPDVAASLNSEPETFPAEDIDLLDDLAPLDVWKTKYDCFDSTPLLFDPSFDHDPLRADRWTYRQLVVDVVMRDPDSVLEHRVCATNFLYAPAQPDDAYFHRPLYDIPPNDVGLSRDPLSDQAWAVTDAIWRWAERRLWLVWRPALVLIATAATLFALGARKGTRVLLLPGLLWAAHLFNVALTSPAQEFRYAYPLYLIGLLTVPLAWLTIKESPGKSGDSVDPAQAAVVEPREQGLDPPVP